MTYEFISFISGRTVPFRVTFKSNDRERTRMNNEASQNEQSREPGGIIGFNLNFVQQDCWLTLHLGFSVTYVVSLSENQGQWL